MEQIRSVIILAVFIITIVYMIKEKRRVPEGQIVQDSLIGKQKALIWILCLLNPIVAGAIFYYGWKKRLPVKAKQANQISLWAFVIEIVLGIVFSVLAG